MESGGVNGGVNTEELLLKIIADHPGCNAPTLSRLLQKSLHTVFHGSYTEVSSPLVKLGRAKVDFGQGFYLTMQQSQAEAWAKTISERRKTGTQTVVSTFSLDMEGIKAGNYRIKAFETYNLEWLEYVIDCRKGGTLQNQYDLVEGGVANDNVIDTVEDYENGVITAEQALGQLKYKAVNHQLCILNQAIVDKYLTFVSSTIIKED